MQMRLLPGLSGFEETVLCHLCLDVVFTNVHLFLIEITNNDECNTSNGEETIEPLQCNSLSFQYERPDLPSSLKPVRRNPFIVEQDHGKMVSDNTAAEGHNSIAAASESYRTERLSAIHIKRLPLRRRI